MPQTFDKAARIFDLFSVERPEWTVTEVAQALALPKSSTSEWLSGLAEQRWLRRTGSGRYRLGWRLVELGQILLNSTEFRTETRLVMEELVAAHGETMHLAVLERGQVFYVEKLQGTRGLQVSISGIGLQLPAHCTGVGKVLLAYCRWSDVVRMIESQGMLAFTPNTITTLETLADALKQVRERGYAYDLEEISLGLCCVAAPIRHFDDRVIAALSMSAPAHRFYPQQTRYTTILLDGARRVSEHLGWRGQRVGHLNGTRR